MKIVGPSAFELLRLDRNRNKITPEEQARLARKRIGIVGLSVGHAIAHLLAMEGLCGELRLADFDEIAITNLNRIPASLLDLGVNKAVIAARRIAEIDPYLPVSIWTTGITAENVGEFLDGLDLVIEECDSLDIKVLLREAARARRHPGGHGDERPRAARRRALRPRTRARPVPRPARGRQHRGRRRARDPGQGPLRPPDPGARAGLDHAAAASLAEVGRTLTTWPQLAGDVTLGAATTAAAVLRLGARADSSTPGRLRVDIDALLGQLDRSSGRRAELDPGSRADQRAPRRPAADASCTRPAAPLRGATSSPGASRCREREFSVFLDPAKSVTMDVAYRGSYVAIGAGAVQRPGRGGRPGDARARPTCSPTPGSTGRSAILHFGRESRPASWLATSSRCCAARPTARRGRRRPIDRRGPRPARPRPPPRRAGACGSSPTGTSSRSPPSCSPSRTECGSSHPRPTGR